MPTALRSRLLGVIVVAAVVAALVAVPGPAAATGIAPPDLVDTCFGVPDSGLPDAGEAGVHATSVDCLAAYGLTQGTAAGTFDPQGTVRRWQMALFVVRLAELADDQLDAFTLPAAGPTPFTDIANLSPEARDAIAVLVELGVVRGVTDTRFAPFDRVTRGQMAAFVNRLQGAIQAALGGDAGGFATADDFFDDDDGTTHEADINAIASVGITTGTGRDNDFEPAGLVTRAQMASFLVRHVGVNVNAGVLTSLFVAPDDPPDQERIARDFVDAVADGDLSTAAGLSTGHALTEMTDAVGGADVVAFDARFAPLTGVLAQEYDAAGVDVVLLLGTDRERFVTCTVAVGLVRRCDRTPRPPGGGLVGEPIDFFWQEGDVLAVVGVAAGDVLNVREVPGAGERVVARLDPLADDLVATGDTRVLPRAFWTRVDVAGTSGWVNTAFIAFIGPTDDATAEVVAELGERPTADTMAELGRIVAETQASEDPPSRIVLVQAASGGDVPDVCTT